jgi:CSLREA domain-containing protein
VTLCALPTAASAEIFPVDTLTDLGDGTCVPAPCSLRDAITASNANPGPDAIEFDVAGTIELGAEPLPSIFEGDVEIDATTAPGWDGTPVVEVDGSDAESEGSTNGLEVFGEGSATIIGLAINGFEDSGILFGFGTTNTICGSYIGTNLSGSASKPNATGIELEQGAQLNEIGYECGGLGNLISGNELFGIVDQAEETRIAANRIGTDATGTAPLPNDFGGIQIWTTAWRPLITGRQVEGPLAPNTIAYNEGPGVLVEDAESYPVIYGNSIFSNEGVGIEFNAGEFTSPPTLESAVVAGGEATIKGTLGGFGTQYLDFYANEECDPSGFGEGQAYIGEAELEGTGPMTPFEVTLQGPVPSGQSVITATATSSGELASTGPFSACLEAEVVPDPPLPQQPPPTPPIASALQPIPVNGRSVVVEPVSGTILVKLPGSNRFQDISELTSIPIGSIIDATRGKVRLTSVNARGVEQSAVFYDGMFQITEQDRSGLVTLRLRGGDFSACRKGAGGSGANASKRPGRRLWGSGKGKFRTEGNFGAAVIRGTIWLTKDQCKGTFFRVRQGTVAVTDFVLDKTFSLPARKKGYWAKKNP